MSSRKMTFSTSPVCALHNYSWRRPNIPRHRATRGAENDTAGHGRYIHNHTQGTHRRLHDGRVRAKKIPRLLPDMDHSTSTAAEGEDRPFANGARANPKLQDRTSRLPPARITSRHVQRPMELSGTLPPRMQQPRGPAYGRHGREGTDCSDS
jgi:hypothetical protein